LAEGGSAGYTILWEAVDPDDPDTVVELAYAPSVEGPWYSITTGLPLTQTSFLWDTSAVPTGEYFVYVGARDGANQQSGVVSVGTVVVGNVDAPPVPEISGIAVDRWTGTVSLEWTPVDAPDLDGYRVYYGYESGAYEEVVEFGPGTISGALVPEMGREVYIVVTSFDSSGNESPFSGEEMEYAGPLRIFAPLIANES
jgi:hypothetical protein